MRKIIPAAVACVTLATQAHAAEPTIVMWNGYSLLISGATTEPNINTATIPEAVKATADRACASVGKAAEAQSAAKVSAFRAEYFYVCL